MESNTDNSFIPEKVKWKRIVFSTAVFVGLSAGVPYLIYRKIGDQGFFLNTNLLSAPFILLTLTMLAVYYTADALRLHYVLKTAGHSLGIRDLGKLTFINILFSNITPMATGGGFAQIWYLGKRGVPLGTATAATTIRTLIAMLLIFLPVPFLVAELPFFQDNGSMSGFWHLLGWFASGYLVVFFVILYRLKWLLRAFDILAKALIKIRVLRSETVERLRKSVFKEATRFSHCIRMYLKGQKRDVLLSVFFTAAFLITLFSFPYLLLWGTGYHTGYFTVTGMLVVSTCVMYFAPSPGGAGFAEGIFGLFFASVVNAADLVCIIVIWRFLTIYLGMLIGIPVTLRELLKRTSVNA
jgi:hypothetical protein